MTNNPQSHVLLDHQIFSQLASCDIVTNQYDFSRLLGRSPSYFSAIRAKKLPISVPSLIKLASELQAKAKSDPDRTRLSVINAVCETIYSEIYARSL